MWHIIQFIEFIVDNLLFAIIVIVVVNAALSWLILFDIVNLRNPAARSVVEFLDRITRPILAPIRRFIPPLGGVDISPFILLLIIIGAQQYLLPPLFLWLEVLTGAPAG